MALYHYVVVQYDPVACCETRPCSVQLEVGG